jgi:hypothetical protein
MRDSSGSAGHLLTLTLHAHIPPWPPGDDPLASLTLDLKVTRLDYLLAGAIALGVIGLVTARRKDQQSVTSGGVAPLRERGRGRDVGA